MKKDWDIIVDFLSMNSLLGLLRLSLLLVYLDYHIVYTMVVLWLNMLVHFLLITFW